MSLSRAFRVVAPTRLHFGLLAIGEGAGASGGAGLMLDEPSLSLAAVEAERFVAMGRHADRVDAVARLWAARREETLPAIELRCEAAPDQHVGLGLGTQLALATAVALERASGRDDLRPDDLARLVDRGKRSGIGARGFFVGGFLAEDEKRAGDSLAPLRARLEFPQAWRIVLLRQRRRFGAHGSREERYFQALPPTPRAVVERMRRRLFDDLVPAVERADFDAFAEAAYRFGRESGELFRGAQGGAYASDFAQSMVDALRERGVLGVGQSSWGPTLWAAASSPAGARSLADDLRRDHAADDLDVLIATPSVSGHRVEPLPLDDEPTERAREVSLSGMRQEPRA